MTTGNALNVPILTSGILAEHICRHAARGEVAAVFAQSFYLRCGDTFVCVADPALGNAPLTLVAAVPERRDPSIVLGQAALLSADQILVGNVRFTFAQCRSWRMPPWPRALEPQQLRAASIKLAELTDREAPPEGLARAMFDARDVAAFACAGRARIAAFSSWLALALVRRTLPSPPIETLIGLGPGLTPSGDDFLTGVLALLDAVGEAGPRATLSRAIRRRAAGLTSPLSACLLDAAAQGLVGERLHQAMAALVTGRIDDSVAACRRIGHSSGWDMLAGAAVALRAVAEHRDALGYFAGSGGATASAACPARSSARRMSPEALACSMKAVT